MGKEDARKGSAARPDAELLSAYAASRDEAAFNELVSRHGAMVYRVCLRVLGDPHESEDAAQATFLVLVRKAGSIRRGGDLAAWLHGAALNVARQAVRARARRARHEEVATMLRTTAAAARLSAEERATVLEGLDRALAALPAGMRQAVVLRYIEGRSQEEAAVIAGCPKNTLASRAMRGLERLRRRLSTRRRALGGAALIALMSAEARAAVPETLLPSLASLAEAVAGPAPAALSAGQAGAGGRVLALAEEGMKAMTLAKAKVIAGTAVKLALLCVAAALIVSQAVALVTSEYRISLVVDTGFYEREDELVRAEIAFDRSADGATFSLRKKGDARETEFYFAPRGRYRGALCWILDGRTDPLTKVTYHLRFKRGRWSEKPFGAPSIAALIAERGNLIPNPGFEAVDPDRGTPVSWEIHGGKPPRRRPLCRLSRAAAHDSNKGKNSLRFDTTLEDGKAARGYAFSPFFPLKPSTRYTFSYHLKIAERDEGSRYVSAEIQFCDREKRRIFPKNYGLNRLQVAYGTQRNPAQYYLRKWVKVERTKETPESVRYGRVLLSSSVVGTIYYDDLVLVETPRGEPMEVSVGKAERAGGRR